MGLAEKRAMAQMRDDVFPKYQAELREITGNDISYVVEWDTFADDLTAISNLEDQCFKRISTIFRKITRDEIGKEAVKEGIKEIHLSQGKEARIQSFTLSNGVLSMPWDWSGWAGSFFPESVQEQIESML